jgi:hypothetical protein
VDVLPANVAPSLPPPEPDGQVPSVVDLSKSQPWRALTVAGFAPGPVGRQALHAAAAQHQTLIQIHSDAAPPHPRELLVLQSMDGQPLNQAGALEHFWHRPPYAMPFRLVRYAPNSYEGEVVDGAVISTRDERHSFRLQFERMAIRLVGDAIAGTGRGAFSPSFDPTQGRPSRRPFAGRFDHFMNRWRQRLFTEWWSIGFTTMPLRDILESGLLGSVQWLASRAGTHYLADPFAWPGTGRLLCEQCSFVEGIGSIVAIDPGPDGTFRNISTILAESSHHSYPCAFQNGDAVYFLPEAPERGGTVLYRLTEDAEPVPICRVAPGRRLADPTLFEYRDRYWIAYTDLDIGEHDNLCLLYASAIEGPWRPHRCVPVKIDICGARSAGVPIRLGNALFRPGQDCAQTYGAGLVIHRVDLLTPDDYRETVVTRLRPDPSGPFPHGMHTLSADEGRVWLDGKRYVFSLSSLMSKLARRARRREGTAQVTRG